MSKKHDSEDRYFNDLSPRFQRNIYLSSKGQLRLAVLRRDFAEFVPASALNVLDVGGGQGQWALELAALGHQVLLTEPSAEMLAEARGAYSQLMAAGDLQGAVTFLQASLQTLHQQVVQTFDVVMCHAVLEWLVEPQQGFAQLLPFMKPGAVMSLIVYNVNGLIMKNLLRTNYRKVLQQDYRGAKGSLTPLNPLRAEDVQGWLAAAGLEVICFSGMRTFHDYVLDAQARNERFAEVETLELQLSRLEPFRSLGRYLHFIARKPDTA